MPTAARNTAIAQPRSYLRRRDTHNLKNTGFLKKDSVMNSHFSMNLFGSANSSNRKQGTYLLKVFFDAKADEITKIYSDGFISNKNELVDMLKQIDPANMGKWDKMLQNQDNR